MTDTKNPFARSGTEFLIESLRMLADHEKRRTENPTSAIVADKLNAAADRLHEFYYALPVSASPAAVGTGTRERELIEARREGFHVAASRYAAMNSEAIDREAARTFPLPQVKRPRVRVDASNVQWRVVGGDVEYKLNESSLGFVRLAGQHMAITLERVDIISDLLDEPTVLVDSDAP